VCWSPGVREGKEVNERRMDEGLKEEGKKTKK